MPIKDRLAELRKSQDTNGQVHVQVKYNAQSGTAELRKTYERTEVIKQCLTQAEFNVRDIKSYLRKLSETANQKDVYQKLDSLFQNNTSIFKQIIITLKQIEAEIESNANSAQNRIKKIQYDTLKSRFTQSLLLNTEELENFKAFQKNIIVGQLKARRGNDFHVDDDELSELLDRGEEIFIDNILAETAEAKRLLQDVEERYHQLLQIERALNDVKNLFVEMSIYVDNQQELVDRIEYQVDTATRHIEEGADDLAKAKGSKKKFTKMKIYLIIFLIVLAVIIIVGFFH